MRRSLIGLLVALACGCGRSALLDDLATGSPDANPATDGAASGGQGSTTGDDASVAEDATMSSDASGDDAPSLFSDGSFRPDASPSPPPPPLDAGCGPLTCQGCCNAQGECVDPTTEQQCGGLGDQCTTCASSEICIGASRGAAGPVGGCGRPQPSCGPSNCDGCCGGGYCFDGIHVEACGWGGHLCEDCQPPGGKAECVPTGEGGGTCNNFEFCSPQTCTGCCSGNVCAQGIQDVACGTGGAACVDCSTQPGTMCIAGACQ